jgi:aminoglycoside/choline kinase family phosphotransferase
MWPTLWETAIELWHNEMPRHRPTFIHRDFHTGNLLWFRGQPSGTATGPTPAEGRGAAT